jgi:membrane fusion protein, multidrug efflux system
LAAPVDDFVTNLSLRLGDYARVGVPIVGLVDDTQWRIVANFKEYVASRLIPGMRTWVWLDSHPWRFFPARVIGVGRDRPAPGRRATFTLRESDYGLDPSRRLQVTLQLDPKPDVPLFMGADVRVLVFF